MNDFIPTNCNATGVFKQIIFVKQPQLKIIVFASSYGRGGLVNCYAYCYDSTFNFNYSLWKMFVNVLWLYTYIYTAYLQMWSIIFFNRSYTIIYYKTKYIFALFLYNVFEQFKIKTRL